MQIYFNGGYLNLLWTWVSNPGPAVCYEFLLLYSATALSNNSITKPNPVVLATIHMLQIIISFPKRLRIWKKMQNGRETSRIMVSTHKREIQTQTDIIVCKKNPMAELAKSSYIDLPLPLIIPSSLKCFQRLGIQKMCLPFPQGWGWEGCWVLRETMFNK